MELWSSTGGRVSLRPNFQKGGAWQDLNFWKEVGGGVAGEEGGDFFQGRVAVFT